MEPLTSWRPEGGASMPVLHIAAVSALTLFVVAIQLRRIDDFPTRFLVIALWARFVMSALHTYTFGPALGGLSINAIGSISITFGALWLARGQMLLRHLAPIYVMIGIGILAAVLNGSTRGVSEFVMRWLYMIGVALLTYRAIRLNGSENVLRALFFATSTLVLLQWVSIATGVVKASENDGSVSYIGGYDHEAAFSTALLLLLVLSTLIRWRYAIMGALVAIAVVAGIFIANYRTNILAALPVIAAGMLVFGLRRVPGRLQPIAILASLFGVLAIALAAPTLMPGRFDDFGNLLREGLIFLDKSEYFTAAQKRILSTRLYIWSWHFETWQESDIINKMIGYGPAAWIGRYTRYAHNTFVSYLVEFGVIGVIAIVGVYLYYIRLVIGLPDRLDAIRLTGCLAGFLVCNLAHQPLWSIEGMMIFGVIVGYAAAASRRPAATTTLGEKPVRLQISPATP